jgi:hypothetical protein
MRQQANAVVIILGIISRSSLSLSLSLDFLLNLRLLLGFEILHILTKILGFQQNKKIGDPLGAILFF